jgi:hypothetical protein
MTLPQHTFPLLHLPATLGGLGLRDPTVATIPAYITMATRSIRYAEHGILLHNTSTTAIAPVHKHVLTQDRYYQILQHYAPSFLPLVPHPQTSVSHPPLSLSRFLQNTDLHGLQRHLYHHHQTLIHQTITDHTPAHMTAILLSLLSPLTSIPLTSMSRRIPTNHLTNDEIRILLQRKLRLPIYPPSQRQRLCNCRSHTPLDPYGDHLFSYTMASKTPLHNYLRDTLYHIMAKLGPIVQIIRTASDVLIEPPSLIPGLPTLCPADIGLHILPPPKYHTTDLPTPFLAIDVTFTHIPNCSTAPNHILPASNPTHQVHDFSARQKYNVPHAHLLLTHNIILLPFTIDHLGGLGFQATQFLFGTDVPAASQPPQWNTTSFRTNPAALDLFHHGDKHTPRAILSKASHQWNLESPERQKFGRTYHTFTPTQWATQALSLNLCKALTHHLITHSRRLLTHDAHQRPTQKNSNATTVAPFYLPPPPFLLPSQTALDLPLASDTLLLASPSSTPDTDQSPSPS